jgi:hypothetical protein
MWADCSKVMQRVRKIDIESKTPLPDEPDEPDSEVLPEAGPSGQRKAAAAAAKAAAVRAQKAGAAQFKADILSMAAEIKRLLKSGAGQTSTDAGDADADHAKKTSPG